MGKNISAIVAPGLHPPWTHGEAIVSRNIIVTLRSTKFFSGESTLLVYSTIDKCRFNGTMLKNVKYIETSNLTKHAVLAFKDLMAEIVERNYYGKVLLQLIGTKEYIWYLMSKILINPSTFKIHLVLYDLGEIPVRFKKIPHVMHLFIDSFIGKLITVSPLTYKVFGKYFKKMYYLPVPYVPPEELGNYDVVNSNSVDNTYKLGEYLNDQTYNIGYIGHLYESRFPYNIVIKTLRKLINSGFRDVKLVIVAPKTEYNLKVSRIISYYVKRLDVERNVVVRVENLKELHKHMLLSSFDVFLFTPIRQPVSMDPPISVLEAMASGSVVISTKYMSVKHIIKDEINGLIVHDLNVDTLYEKIANVLKHDTLKEYLSRNAKQYILKRHYYKTVAPILEKILVESL